MRHISFIIGFLILPFAALTANEEVSAVPSEVAVEPTAPAAQAEEELLPLALQMIDQEIIVSDASDFQEDETAESESEFDAIR